MASRRSSRKRKRGKRPTAKDYCGAYEDPPGFEVKHIDEIIGEGTFVMNDFYKGDFLLEYKGTLIKDLREATQLEALYSEKDLGSFMFFFKYRGKQMCIDATHDILHQARMVNDAKTGEKEQNCAMKIVEIAGNPHLCLFASRHILEGEELRFDYGVSDLPWRLKGKEKQTKGQAEFDTQKNGESAMEDPYTSVKGKDQAEFDAQTNGESVTKDLHALVIGVGQAEFDTQKNGESAMEDLYTSVKGVDQAEFDAQTNGESVTKDLHALVIGVGQAEFDTKKNGESAMEDLYTSVKGVDQAEFDAQTNGESVTKDLHALVIGVGQAEFDTQKNGESAMEDLYTSVKGVDQAEFDAQTNGESVTKDLHALVIGVGQAEFDTQKNGESAMEDLYTSVKGVDQAEFDAQTNGESVTKDLHALVIGVGQAEFDTQKNGESAMEDLYTSVKGVDQAEFDAQTNGESVTKDLHALVIGVGQAEFDTQKNGESAMEDLYTSVKGVDQAEFDAQTNGESVTKDLHALVIGVGQAEFDTQKNGESAMEDLYTSVKGVDQAEFDAQTNGESVTKDLHALVIGVGQAEFDTQKNGESAMEDLYTSVKGVDQAEFDAQTNGESVTKDLHALVIGVGQAEFDTQKNGESAMEDLYTSVKGVDQAEFDAQTNGESVTKDLHALVIGVGQAEFDTRKNGESAMEDPYTSVEGADQAEFDAQTNGESVTKDLHALVIGVGQKEDDDVESKDEDQKEEAGKQKNKNKAKDKAANSSGKANSSVQKAKKKSNGSIILDKQQYCYFCNSANLKLARHILSVHKNEPQVIRLQALKENPTSYGEYLKQLKKLRNLGNFKNNVDVLKKGGSNIVVVKRPIVNRKITDYVPCPHCLGFYCVEELWRHANTCDLKTTETEDSKRNPVIIQSRLILESAACPEGSENLNSEPFKDVSHEIVQKMAKDEIYETVIKDRLILYFGAILLKKLGPKRAKDISQRMRQLARLLINANTGMPEPLTLDDILSSKHFDDVIQATEDLCLLFITSDGRRGFEKPSLAIRLGHLLGKAAQVKKGISLRDTDTVREKEAKSFLSLLNSEWTDTISSNALHTLKRRKDHQINLLPLTEDLLKIRQYQEHQLAELTGAIEKSPTYFSWRKLSRVVMTRLIIFNKRRGGEVAKMLLSSFTNRPDWKKATNSNAEVMATLLPLEAKLLNRVDLVQIPGKKNRKVPMLITDKVKNAMNVLVSTRNKVEIPEDNPYFFASRSQGGFLDSWQAMNHVVSEAEVTHPEYVTSTKLRKYNATVCQLFDLNNGELEWLSNHMGHDLAIHKDFYRLHDSTIEIAKVSRLLMAVDSGKASAFHGKKLEDIEITDFDEGSDEEDNELDDISFDAQLVSEQRNNADGISNEEEYGSKGLMPEGNHKRKRKWKRIKDIESSSDEEHCPKRQNIESSSDEEHCPKRQNIESSSGEEHRPKRQSFTQRQPWTQEVTNLLWSSFGENLKNGVYPTTNRIKLLQQRNECLQTRTVVQIKAKLQHLKKKGF